MANEKRRRLQTEMRASHYEKKSKGAHEGMVRESWRENHGIKGGTSRRRMKWPGHGMEDLDKIKPQSYPWVL